MGTIYLNEEVYGGGSGGDEICVPVYDISSFTKVYDTLNSFGNSGAKINTNLGITNEVDLYMRMNGGWNAAYSSCYDAENKTGAYGGYEFDKALHIDFVRFYIGKYVQQNITLYATAQYLNANNEWFDVEDMEVSSSISYPVSYFDVSYKNIGKIYGVRWIHKKSPIKSSGNNITFFGMIIFKLA